MKTQQILKAKETLDKHLIDFECKNNGIHLIVTDYSGNKIDFYPTTGKWTVRNGVASNGLNNLVRHIAKEL